MKKLLSKNTLFVLALGFPLALAVTTTFELALVVGIFLLLIMAIYSPILALVKIRAPKKILIPSLLITMALLVTLVELLINRYTPEIAVSIGVYLPLLSINALFLNYNEIINEDDKFKSIFIKMMTATLSFVVGILIFAFIREILGSGTLTLLDETSSLIGYRAVYKIYEAGKFLPISILVKPNGGIGGAFILMGLMMALFKGVGDKNA